MYHYIYIYILFYLLFLVISAWVQLICHIYINVNTIIDSLLYTHFLSFVLIYLTALNNLSKNVTVSIIQNKNKWSLIIQLSMVKIFIFCIKNPLPKQTYCLIGITKLVHQLHQCYMMNGIIHNIKTTFFLPLFEFIMLMLIAFVYFFVKHNRILKFDFICIIMWLIIKICIDACFNLFCRNQLF